MLIKNVTVEGFRVYKSRKTFDFSQGINLIVAPNGSGKSTILYALRLLMINKGDVNLDEFIHTGLDQFYIEAEFTHLNREYKVTLLYKKSGKTGSSTRKLYIDDIEKEVAINSDAISILAEIFDPELTGASLFSMQGKNEIIEVTDSERREILKKLQELTFKKEIEKLEEQIKSFEEGDVDLSKRIYALESKTFERKELKELPLSDKEEESKRLELSVLMEKKANYDAQKKHLESVLSHIKSLEEREDDLLNEQDSIKGAKEKAENELRVNFSEATYTDSENAYNTSYKEVEEEIRDLEQTEPPISKKEIEIQEKRKKDEETLQEKKEELSEIKIARFPKNPTEKLNSEINDLVENKAEVSAEKNQILSKLDSVNNGTCPECGRPYTASHKSELEVELSQLELNEEKLSNSIEELKEERNSILEKIEENTSKVEKRSEIKSTIENLEHRISTAKENADLIREQVKRERKNLINEKKRDLSDLRIRWEDSKTKFNDKKESLTKTIEESEEQLFEISAKIKKTHDELGLIETPEVNEDGINELSFSISTLEKVLTDNSETRQYNDVAEAHNREMEVQEKDNDSKITKLQEEKTNLLETKTNYVTAKAILQKDFPNYIIERLVGAIEDDINDFISTVYTKDLNIQFRQTKTAIKMVYGAGDKKVSAKGLSGAEKKLTQIGFIHSLNRKQELGALILDEPDSSLDDRNSLEFFESLGTMGQLYKQLIIITHNSKMKSYLISNYEPNVLSL